MNIGKNIKRNVGEEDIDNCEMSTHETYRCGAAAGVGSALTIVKSLDLGLRRQCFWQVSTDFIDFR